MQIIKILSISILVFLISIFVVNKIQSSQFAKPIGRLETGKNEKLQTNINIFMESQKSDYILGKNNYHCANHLYGYDDKYAYAWVYCSGFIIKPNNQIEQGSAFSAPTRLEYKMPDFQIVNYKQPGIGNSNPTLQQLFPKQFYDLAIKQSSTPEIQKFDQEIRSKINQNSITSPPAGKIVIQGIMTCLSNKDSSEPQTLACALGLKDDSGRYFALSDTDPNYKNTMGIPMNVRVEVEGKFEPQIDSKFQDIGRIQVSRITKLD